MPSFSITAFSSTSQTLGNQQTGFIGVNGSLVTTSEAVVQDGFVSYLVVLGSIVGAGSATAGVDMNGDNMRINVGATGNITSTNFWAISADPTSSNWITNAGVIHGSSGGIRSITPDGAADIRIFNSGDITGNSDGISVGPGENTGRIVNSGSIVGLSSDGIFVSDASLMLLNNSGVISGEDYSYRSTDTVAVDRINNSGEMFGEVSLGGGDDVYLGIGDGFVAGTIDGGDGNDFIRGGTDVDVIFGGSGIDILRGGDGDDELNGEGGADEINGGDGHDLIDGGGGDDTAHGGTGNDDIIGRAGDDSLHGGQGNDTLDGHRDNDLLHGGEGNDIVIGGLGTDTLLGGLGNDVFVFLTAADSTNDADRDRISDFEIGADLIDISALGGVFTFIGEDAFSDAREVRVVENGGNSTLFIDTDQDGVADMRIFVSGVTGLSETDFIL